MTEVIPARAVATWLAAQNLAGGTTGWGLSFGKFPDDGAGVPDNCIVVFRTGDVLEGRLMKAKDQTLHYGIMVQARSKATQYEAGELKLESIRAALADMVRELVADGTDGDTPVVLNAFTATTGILPFGQEKEGRRRHMFSLNGLLALSAGT